MDDITVRLALDDEWDHVAQLRWDWRVQELGRTPAVEHEEFTRELGAWARRNSSSHRCMVVLRGDEIVGMGWLAITERVPSPGAIERTSGDVQCVYVKPGHRDAGLGGRLIDALVQLAHGIGLERVTVHSSKRAVSAYRRHGFSDSPQLLQATIGMPT